MSRILLIDNYDSFTYNLYHYLEDLSGNDVVVMRNNEIDFDKAKSFKKIVISPGPGLPEEAGDLLKFLNCFIMQKEILGICLGQQAIACHFGMKLKNLGHVVHGQTREINVDTRDRIYRGIPKTIKVGRYHSWVIDSETMSKEFNITATDEEGNIMSISHSELPVSAVQFHPESVLTEYGKEMIRNWLN